MLLPRERFQAGIKSRLVLSTAALSMRASKFERFGQLQGIVHLQQKTGRPVQFEVTEQARRSLGAWIAAKQLGTEDWLFPSRKKKGAHLTTRQYGRLVDQWVDLVGLDPAGYGTHSMRRTKVSLLYKKTGNLRACQLLLGHTKLESTVRYLGVQDHDPGSQSAGRQKIGAS